MKRLMALSISLMLSNSTFAVVDLNTATQSELETVKGIGPAKAQRIIEYRQKNGSFRNLDALASVNGFGKASVARLRNELVAGGAARPNNKK